MMNSILLLLAAFSTLAIELPTRHIELLPFVQESPDQGDAATCLYMGTTGAIELLLNQKYNIRHPNVDDMFNISERFSIHVRTSKRPSSWHLTALPRFNKGWAIHHRDLVFNAYKEDGTVNRDVWRRPTDFYQLPRMKISERFKATRLFIRGSGRHSQYVAKKSDLLRVKKALVNNNAPVLINYNHNRWWHVINIVGYDDELMGECTHTPSSQCTDKGAFYVRDSLGIETHTRSYGWFMANVNAAFSVQIK